MPNTFSPERLQRELEPLDRQMAHPPAELANYVRYYDLDLIREFPGLNHQIGQLDSGEHQLAVQIFTPVTPRGSAVVCHGYYDHVGLYGHLIRYLLTHDLRVVAFDQPGHGLSSGPCATIESFDIYVAALERCLDAVSGSLPGPWHLLGQSMGASVVLEYLAGRRPSPSPEAEERLFTEVVLFAPLVRPALWPINSVVFNIVKRFASERPRTFRSNAQNPEFLALVREDPLQAKVLPVQWVSALVDWMERFESYPRLPVNPKIVQGHTDRTVGWRYNLKVLDRMCQPEVLHIPKAGHHLVNEAESVRRQIWQWLDESCGWN